VTAPSSPGAAAATSLDTVGTATEELRERARRVRLLVLDVDGVLTDGRLHITADGEQTKVFHVRDGSGLVALQRAGVAIAIISGRESGAVRYRAAELGIGHVRQGIRDKGAALDALLLELGVGNDALGCVGDDTPDVPMLQRAAFAVAVADAHPTARAVAHWVTPSPGGHGAVRDVCDLLLAARGS
jgi:3-deoxy-D-manno-octulosonate 8-phosphate phosphatase (KDO 8-P phosphatase)